MSIRLNLHQARQLLEFFGGEDADVTLNDTPLNMHSGPGLYAWLTEHPDEGSIKLDEEPQPEDAPPCQKCGQTDHGQTGEYACAECGLPTLWDGSTDGVGVAPDQSKPPSDVDTGKDEQ